MITLLLLFSTNSSFFQSCSAEVFDFGNKTDKNVHAKIRDFFGSKLVYKAQKRKIFSKT